MNGIVYEILLDANSEEIALSLIPRTIALSFEDAMDRKQLLLEHDGNEDSVYVVLVEEAESNNAHTN